MPSPCRPRGEPWGRGSRRRRPWRNFRTSFSTSSTGRFRFYGIKGERAVIVELVRRVADGELPISALSDGARPPEDRNR